MAETLKTKIKYPSFSGRNYVVALLDNPNNKPEFDPASFFLARWYLTPKDKKREAIEAWLKQKPKPTKYKGVITIGKKWYENITSGELFSELEKAVRREYNGSSNFINMDYRDIFFINDKEHHERRPFAGQIHLEARLKPKEGGTKRRRFNQVFIKGYLSNSRIPFDELRCNCEDHLYDSMKEGYTHNHYSCIDIAAALLIARYHPDCVQNLRSRIRGGTKVSMPFHVHEPQPFSERVYSAAHGKQPDFSFLMVDVLFDFLLNNSTKFDISKKITKIPVIYNPSLLAAIYDSKADYEVIVNKYIFKRDNPVPEQVRAWFERIDSYLTERGFEFKGLVLENKNSEHEVIAMNYVKGNESRRLVFSKLPPLEIKRVFDDEAETDIFKHEKIKSVSYKHPYSELFRPQYGKGLKVSSFDDATRKMPSFYEVRIPWYIGIPREMMIDYHNAIDAFGMKSDKLMRWLYKRNAILKNAGYNADVIDTMSLFRAISRAV